MTRRIENQPRAQTAAYFRERRALLRARRIGYNKKDYNRLKPDYDEDDPLYHPKFVKEGQEILKLLRADDYVDADSLCACGCGQPHNNNVAKVIKGTGPFGTVCHRVLWYRYSEHVK